MENGVSASDVIALTKGGDMFGGVGGFILLFIFLMAISGNGFGWGGNSSTGLALADIQASLYNQTQDANARNLAQGQCSLTDTILNASYNNLSQMKDMQYQISNSIAGISNQIANQTASITNMFNEAQIRELSDKLATTRDELSNTRQTAILTDAITNQTNTILNAQGKYYLNPPCYQGCGCGALV